MGNDRLERYERKKLLDAMRGDKDIPSGKRSAFSFKEWVGIMISCAAFGLSTVTTYLSTFRTEDDIRIFFRSPPLISHEAGSRYISLSSNSDWTITNAGNRAASISGAVVSLVKDQSENGEDCSGQALMVTRLSLMPFVIQPKQVEIRRVRLENYDAKSKSTSEVNQLNEELTGGFQAGDEIKLQACVSVFVYTPDEAVRAKQTVFSGTWKFDKFEYGPRDVPKFEALRPWILIKKTTTKFL